MPSWNIQLTRVDNSIIATAIPKITDQFQSLSDVGWYGSGKLELTNSVYKLFYILTKS